MNRAHFKILYYMCFSAFMFYFNTNAPKYVTVSSKFIKIVSTGDSVSLRKENRKYGPQIKRGEPEKKGVSDQ